MLRSSHLAALLLSAPFVVNASPTGQSSDLTVDVTLQSTKTVNASTPTGRFGTLVESTLVLSPTITVTVTPPKNTTIYPTVTVTVTPPKTSTILLDSSETTSSRPSTILVLPFETTSSEATPTVSIFQTPLSEDTEDLVTPLSPTTNDFDETTYLLTVAPTTRPKISESSPTITLIPFPPSTPTGSLATSLSLTYDPIVDEVYSVLGFDDIYGSDLPYSSLDDSEISSAMENFQDYATATTSAGPFGITSMPAIAGSSLSLASPTTTAGLEIFPADLQAQITSAAVWASILDAPDSAKTAILEPFVDGLVSELEGATPSPTYLASMFLNPDPEYLEIASSAVSEFNSNLMAMASLAPSASQGVSGALQSYRSYAHDNADLLASYVEFAAEIQGLKSELAEEAFRRYRSATLFEEAVSFHQSATSFEEAVSSFQSTTSEASLVIETATVVSPIVVSATRTKVLGTTSPLLKPQGLKVSASSTFIPTATTTITSVVTNTITWTTAFVTTGPTLQERACASVEPYVSCTSLGLLYGSSMVTLTTRVPQRKPDAPENSTGQFEDMTEWISQLPGSVKQLFENDELSRLVILHKGDVDIEYNTGLQRIKAKREAETSTEDSSSDKSRECLSLYLACMREPSPVHSKPVPHHQMPPYHQRTNECHKKQLACLRGYSRFLQWKKPHSVHSGDMDKRDASPQNQRPQKPYPVFEDDKGGKVVIIDEGKVTLKINDWGLSSQGSGSA